MLAGRSRTASLVTVMNSSAKWNLRPRRRAFMRGNRQNRMVQDQESTEGVAKLWPVALQVPLTQGRSSVQGRCRVSTANSSYAEAEDAYDELYRLNHQGVPCSWFCLPLHLLVWIPCERFHLDKKQFRYHLFFSPVLSRFFCRGDTGVFQAQIFASVADHTRNTMINL